MTFNLQTCYLPRAPSILCWGLCSSSRDMPSYNITVPAASPLIRYSAGNWTFSAAAAICTNWQNASCSLSIPFGATGIVIQGTAVGDLPVTIDGTAEKSDSPDFGVVFAKGGLAPGPHILDLHFSPNSDTYAEGLPEDFEINSINILMGDGDTTTLAQSARLEPMDTNFTYLQKNYVGIAEGPTINGGISVSIGNLENPFANISFYGNDIAVYGVIGRAAFPCRYNVSLDGDLALVSAIVPTNLTSPDVTIPSALLYQSGNLTSGLHHVLITVYPDLFHLGGNFSVSGQLDLEHADVHTYVDLSASTGTPVNTAAMASASMESATEPFTSTTQSSTPINRSSLPTAPIAGGVLGGLVLTAVTMTCAFYFLRRRFRRTRFTFVGADGIDGGDPPARQEEDMPPPGYQQVFARDSEAPGHGGHAPTSGQRGRANGRSMLPRGLFHGKPQHALPPSVQKVSEPQHHPVNVEEPITASPAPPLPRSLADPSLLAWKEQLPQERHDTSSKLE